MPPTPVTLSSYSEAEAETVITEKENQIKERKENDGPLNARVFKRLPPAFLLFLPMGCC